MISTGLLMSLLLAVIGCGIISGIFLAFSDFVMRSLKLASPEAGVEVMQTINREVYRSVFMVLLWGMVAVSVGLVSYAYLYLNGIVALTIIAGGAVYVAGVLIVSFLFNIPMNNTLEAMSFSSLKTATYWQDRYVSRWVFWNWIRTIASGTSAICFLVAALKAV